MLGSDTIIPVSASNEGYLAKKWTLDEFKEELKQPIEAPAIDDPDDPLYYKKYAHTLPPKEAYFFIPNGHDTVALDDASKNVRLVYFGWDNITDFERRGVRALQIKIKEKGVTQMPPGFTERDWLKWV